MSQAVAVSGCALAAVAAFLPLRRPAYAGAVALAVALWLTAAARGGADAVRPLAAICVFLATLLARRLVEDRRRAERLLAVERSLRQAASHASAAAERERIARDLHDGVTHLLTSQLLVLQTAAAALEDHDLALAGTRLDHGVRLSRQALAEARDVVHALAGTGPDVALVRDTVADWQAATGRPATTSLPPALPALDGAVWGALLATLREALTNIARHAPHGRVRVVVAPTAAGLRLDVEDEPDSAAEQRGPGVPPGVGSGLQGLRERAALIGGRLTAGPAASGGRGWRVSLTVPSRASDSTAP